MFLLHTSPCYCSFLFTHRVLLLFFFFFFNDTATTEIYTLSLHDALPIYRQPAAEPRLPVRGRAAQLRRGRGGADGAGGARGGAGAPHAHRRGRDHGGGPGGQRDRPPHALAQAERLVPPGSAVPDAARPVRPRDVPLGERRPGGHGTRRGWRLDRAGACPGERRPAPPDPAGRGLRLDRLLPAAGRLDRVRLHRRGPLPPSFRGRRGGTWGPSRQSRV